MIYSILESTVENILRVSGRNILKTPSDNPIGFDFGFETSEGRKVALEVKGKATIDTFAGIVGQQLRKSVEAGYDELWLVTPEPPRTRQGALTGLAGGPKPAFWFSLQEFALKMGVVIPNTDWKELSDLKLEAEKKNKPSTPSPTTEYPPQLAALVEQLPIWTALDTKTPGEVDQLLGFGKRHEKVIVVFSDIRSFSQIVQNAEPEALNEMLTKYYGLARQRVRANGGVFDKVIGDAVLAVFNYPKGATEPFTDALRFGVELIREGRALFGEFFNRSVPIIETGTRVAVTCGDVWPINVGDALIQTSFIGHTVNLAARLQHVAEVDGIILCQKTANLLFTENSDLANQLQATHRVVRKGELAGIATDINTQLVSPATVSSVAIPTRPQT